MNKDRTEERAEPRTNLFVAATIATDAMSGPVRLRNISPSGARVEAADLPNVGARVRLRRGTLSVSGVVGWRNDKSMGMRFDRPTDVQLWLPNGQSSQQTVDKVVNAIRLGDHPAPTPAPARNSESYELLSIADLLDGLGDALSEDPDVVAKYFAKLQVLDIATQKLRQIGSRKT